METERPMSKYIVYCHTNLINGKQYVGMTSMSFEERWGKNGSRYRNCRVFWDAIQQYGWDNFAHKILAYELTEEQACELERHYISEFNTLEPNGYNVLTGGIHYTMTEAQRQNLSVKKLGNKSRTGMKNSEAHKQRMSELMKGNTYGQVNAERYGKPVVQYTKDNRFVAEYKTICEASRETGISRVCIRGAVDGKFKQAGGYLWKRRGK